MERIFRGKTLTGRWVEGSYYKQEEFYGSKEDADVIITSKESLTYDQALDYAIVIPETVGQYTGRNVGADKLFEGDIIEWVEDYDDNWGDSKTYIGRSLIIWDNDNSCWAVKTDTYIQFFNDFSWDRCYVIGNIHDNPELLEVN